VPGGRKVPWDVAVKSSVYPSGGASATACVPMAPLAPALLSTMTATLRASASLGCTMRAMRSAPVPGVKGTTIVTFLCGYWA